MLFLGCERDLLIFNILTYSMFDCWLNDTASAVFLCYLLDCAVSYYRRTLGRVSGLIPFMILPFVVHIVYISLFFVIFYADMILLFFHFFFL